MRGKALFVLSLAALLTPLAALPAGSAVKCFGEDPTIYAVPGHITRGTDGDDVIVGTDGDDDIRGGKGRDRICGRGGDDYLRGAGGRDRISGGGGVDAVWDEGGRRNVLIGGPGNDSIQAHGDGDSAIGNGGADYIYTYAGNHTSVQGGPGDDVIDTGDWTKLDAGDGTDDCRLETGVVPVNCETLRLLCGGTGGIDLPEDVGSLPGLTSAPGDFDGDPDEDTLYLWHDPVDGWIIHIELDSGYGVQHVLGNPAEYLAAIGGYDINGDGIDEAFAQVDSSPRRVVGIGTVYLPFTASPYNCTLEGLQFGSGSTAQFPIGTEGDITNGLGCRGGEHTIRQFVQEDFLPVPGTVIQHRYDSTYSPNFGVDQPQFVDFEDSHPVFDPADPADAAILQRGGEFHCGGLELP